MKTEDDIKKENDSQVVDEPPPEDEKPSKRGRRIKLNIKPDEKPCCKKKKSEESDSESEVIKTESISEVLCEQPDDDNNNLPAEKVEPSESSQILSDFCAIVENAHKLEANSSVEEEESSNTADDAVKQEQTSPSKENDKARKHKRPGDRHKRKISQSMNDDDYYKHPRERKGKRTSPPLEYNVDFMSDLSKYLMN